MCISNHILESFLLKRRAEVLKAMTIDMTFERREVLMREEEREYGRAEGRAVGHAEGHAEGRAEGLIEGRAEGIRTNAIQVYRNCLARGMSEEDAISISGITEDMLKTITE